MAKDTGTQAADAGTTATVDKAAEAKAAAAMEKASETDAIGVGALPDSTFNEAPGGADSTTEFVEQPPAKEEAAPVEAAPKPEEPAPEPAPEAATEATTFDAAAFATKYDVKDADLFKDCKDEAEASDVLCRRAAFWSGKYGEQTAEVGQNRQEIARLQAEAQARATAEVGAEHVAPAQPTSMTAEQVEEYLQLADTDPLAARRMLDRFDGVGAGAPTGLTVEEVEQRVEERLIARDEQRTAAADMAALAADHPDWETRKPEMQTVAQELGFYPQPSTAYALAGLRHQNPAGFAGVMAKMQAGLSYDDARVLVIDHPAGIAAPAAATGHTAQQEAKRRTVAAREAGTGINSSVTAQPASETDAIGISGLDRETAGGDWLDGG